MKLIDAINLCLRSSNIGSINDIDDPSAKAAHARTTVARVQRRILASGYRWNTTVVTLTPNTSGRVPVPSAALSVLLPRYYSPRVAEDDGGRYVWDDENGQWHDSQIEASIVKDYDDFADIPELFAQWIAYSAACDYYFEQKASQPSDWLVRKMIDAEAQALNSLEYETIFNSTGHSYLDSLPTGSGRWYKVV